MAIFRKQVFKQAIRGAEKKIDIMAILNRYKDTLENLVDSLNIKPPKILKPIDKRPRNIMPSFENLLTEPELIKNILDRSQRQ